jgi:uncharacterized membrane protein YbhN (UPF0104 family)
MLDAVTAVGTKPDRRPASHGVAIAVGIAVSVICVWLVTRNVQWSQLLIDLRNVRPAPFIAAVAAVFGTYVVMAYRWRVLLAGVVTVADAFDFTMIGFVAGLVVPQRLGDVAKVVLLARRARVSRTMVLGSVVLERLADVIMLLVLAAVFALMVKLPVLLGTGLLVLALVTAGVIAALWSGPALWQRLLSPARWVLPPTTVTLGEALILKFSAGVNAIRNGPQSAAALALTALLWVLSGASMSAYIVAFGLAVPWYAGFLVILLTNLAGILPSSPGSIGVYHYMTVLALTVWTADRTAALAFAIVTHATAMLLILLTGGWSLARQGLSLRAVRGEV